MKIIKKGGRVVVKKSKKETVYKKKVKKVIKKKAKAPRWTETQEAVTRTGTSDQGGIEGTEQKFVVKERNGKTRDAAWYIKKLDKHADVKYAKVQAMRRQCKGNGRPIQMVDCKLVKRKVKGKWRLELRGGITGKEWLDADWHAGDCFFNLRLRGWTVHHGKLNDDPRWDYFWIPGPDMTKALTHLGWI